MTYSPSRGNNLLASLFIVHMVAVPAIAQEEEKESSAPRPVAMVHAGPETESGMLEFPADRSVVEIPFQTINTKIVVPVTINGSGPYDFVLDTGASSALFDDPAASNKLEVQTMGMAQVGGAGGDGPRFVSMARDVTLGLGAVQLHGAMLAITPTDQERLMPGADWQGVFGSQVFSNLVVEIDWEEELLRLYDPSTYQAPADTRSVPLRVGSHHVYVQAEIQVDNGETRSVELVIDTGAGHALALGPSAGSRPEKRIEGAYLGYGLGGAIRGDLGRIDSLSLGDSALHGVVTSFPDDKYAPVITSGTDGNLGAEVLRRFRTTFDYHRERMLLQPTEALGEPFDAPTSGLFLRPWLDETGAAVIDHVVADSPAGKAGLQAGDTVVAAEGQPVQELSLAALGDLLRGKAGTEVQLTVARGDQRREVLVILQQLI